MPELGLIRDSGREIPDAGLEMKGDLALLTRDLSGGEGLQSS